MENKILENLKDDNELKKFLNSSTGEDLKKSLIYLNSKVRNIPIEDGGLFQQEGYYLPNGTFKDIYVKAAELKAPKKEIQNQYFDKMTELLKNVDNRKDKAVVMYYLINYLHLFEDGNGRTSRIAYDLLSHGKIVKEDEEYYAHTDNSNIGNRNGFLSERNIANVKTVGNCASYILLKYLIDSGLIDNSEDYLTRSALVQTRLCGDMLYINKEAERILSNKDIQYIVRALTDNNEYFSSAGLAILVMLTKKNSMRPLNDFYRGKDIKPTNNLTMNPIYIGNEEGEFKPKEYLMKDWKPEDYLCAIEITDKLKEGLMDLFIDFAERPDSFKFNKEGLNMIEMLKQGDIIDLNQEFSEILTLSEAPFEIDKESRTYKNMKELREIVNKQRKIKRNSVESLGIQTSEQQKNIELKDKLTNKINTEEKIKTGGPIIWI